MEKTWWTVHGLVTKDAGKTTERTIVVTYAAPGYEGASWNSNSHETPSKFNSRDEAIRFIQPYDGWNNGFGYDHNEVHYKWIVKHYRKTITQTWTDSEVEKFE